MKKLGYEVLIERALDRYQLGGFLKGDVVTLAKGYKNEDKFKKLTRPMQEFIKMIDSEGFTLVVMDIHNN